MAGFPPHQPASSPETHSGPTERSYTSLWPTGELIQYFCFVVVAEELHFTRAAARLHMDQSVVSRHIQKLEVGLGVKLFVRGDRKVELTEAGGALLPFARKLLISANAGARITRAIGRGEPEEFEVAYSPLVDIHLIAQIKELVESCRPAISIRFRSVAPEKLAERLLAGVSQAGIAILPLEDDVGAACIEREELFVVLPADHRLAGKSKVVAAEIGDDSVVWASGATHSAFTKHLFGLFRRSGFVPNVTQDVQTVAEALGLTRERLGVTFVKASDRNLVGEGLAVRPLARPLFVETGLLYLRERRWDVLTRFVSLVTARFRCEKQNPA
jgi:DNA-binding transcriptional LysR family regulator